MGERSDAMHGQQSGESCIVRGGFVSTQSRGDAGTQSWERSADSQVITTEPLPLVKPSRAWPWRRDGRNLGRGTGAAGERPAKAPPIGRFRECVPVWTTRLAVASRERDSVCPQDDNLHGHVLLIYLQRVPLLDSQGNRCVAPKAGEAPVREPVRCLSKS